MNVDVNVDVNVDSAAPPCDATPSSHLGVVAEFVGDHCCDSRWCCRPPQCRSWIDNTSRGRTWTCPLHRVVAAVGGHHSRRRPSSHSITLVGPSPEFGQGESSMKDNIHRVCWMQSSTSSRQSARATFQRRQSADGGERWQATGRSCSVVSLSKGNQYTNHQHDIVYSLLRPVLVFDSSNFRC